MRLFRSFSTRHKRAAVTLAMCSVASLAGVATKVRAMTLVNRVQPQDCGGAGQTVSEGECYPGYGNTGSVCGSGGYWEVGCTG